MSSWLKVSLVRIFDIGCGDMAGSEFWEMKKITTQEGKWQVIT
jgi:hypothetical protein